MKINADYEAELLGAERPIDICTDPLDESLLCTPSRGVFANKPMSIDDEVLVPESCNIITPTSEQGNSKPPTTFVHTVTASDTTLATNNKSNNPLTQEQAEAVKKKLSDLLHQASTLTATNTTKQTKLASNSDDVILLERQIEMQERQLTV